MCATIEAGTARCAIRAAFSGTIDLVDGQRHASSARCTRVGTPQRGVPTTRTTRVVAIWRDTIPMLPEPGLIARAEALI